MMKKAMIFKITTYIMLITFALAACSTGIGSNASKTELLSNPDKHYAVRYPTGYKVVNYSEMGLAILKGDLLERGQPRADINVMPNPFIALESAVAEYVAMYPGFDLTLQNIEIDGIPATVLDGVPGQDPTRIVLCIYNDKVYKFNFFPADSNYGQPYRDMEVLYDTIISSFDFDPEP